MGLNARLIFTYFITLALGSLMAFGVALLLGLLWPSAKVPAFVLLTACWWWIGWRYVQARDRSEFR